MAIIDVQGLSTINTIMFDFYGTVVDIQKGLIAAIRPYLQSKGYDSNSPARVVTWWRRTHFENSMIDSLLGRGHVSYREISRQALDYTLTRAGIPHTMAEVNELVAHVQRLQPFPEVLAALRRMRDSGLDLAILSNGDPDMLQSGIANSGTAGLWSRAISVAEIGYFKPHHATYQTAVRLIDRRPDEVLFAANHAFDCVGAKGAGLPAAFVNRRGRPVGNEYYQPDLIVENVTRLAEVLGADSTPTQLKVSS
jgi:2-haloacid dehalogenase